MFAHRLARAALALSLCLLSAAPAAAQRVKPEAAAADLPEGLRHVPRNALGFVHIRVGDFLKSDLGKQLLARIEEDREATKTLSHFGLQVAEVESVTVLFLQPPAARLHRPRACAA